MKRPSPILLRVLLIEDDPDFAAMLRARLTDAVRSLEMVAWCTRAQEGIDAVFRLFPDVVLLDLQLADGSGLQVIPAVRQRMKRTALRIYAMTSAWNRDLRRDCIAAGTEDCFDKAHASIIVDEMHRLAQRERRRGVQAGYRESSMDPGSM
jgi:two-component system OmpR family response regulator